MEESIECNESRDIKLENALLNKNKQLVKLTDFGFAKGPEDSLPKSNVGTPNYAGQCKTWPLQKCNQSLEGMTPA